MAVNNNTRYACKEQGKVHALYEKLVILNEDAVSSGVSVEDLQEICFKRGKRRKIWQQRLYGISHRAFAATVATAVFFGVFFGALQFDKFTKTVRSYRCALQNNFFIMEATRPVTDCSICKGVNSVLILENVTREEFAKVAYTSRPMLVKGAASNWSAVHTFNFSFFKQLYADIDGAYDSIEEECQFFPFQTTFLSLRDVFQMPDKRARFEEGEDPWYIGWSNCHPDVASILRQHYSRPHFLPEGSEISAIDWIFMGGFGRGASLHLDYVSRPSWQAQISGSKTWQLVPTPECENMCSQFNVTVNKGDIVLIDTNQWYHDTFINPGELSITIGSEYG